MYKYFITLMFIFTISQASEIIVCQINAYSGGIKNGDLAIQCNSDSINDTTIKNMYSNNWKIISTSGNYLIFQRN